MEDSHNHPPSPDRLSRIMGVMNWLTIPAVIGLLLIPYYDDVIPSHDATAQLEEHLRVKFPSAKQGALWCQRNATRDDELLQCTAVLHLGGGERDYYRALCPAGTSFFLSADACKKN